MDYVESDTYVVTVYVGVFQCFTAPVFPFVCPFQ